MRAIRGVRTFVEQSLVYGLLVIMLILMILFGIVAAEKGINSLSGTDESQALVVSESPQGETNVTILGKNVAGSSEPSWSQQLSRDLEQSASPTGEAVDQASISIGTWLEAGARKVLDVINDIFR